VKITKKDVVGKADLLIYYNLDEKAILTGHPSLWRNQDYFQADKIMVYLGQVSSVVLEGKAEGKYFYKL
jgi:lipopolysaccharide export system protein LptA